MSRTERWIVYPLLALLSLAVFGRREWTGGSAAAGEPRADAIEARSLRILDDHGVARIVLSTTSGLGDASIQVRDSDGKLRASLGYRESDGASLRLSDGLERIGAALYLWPFHGAELLMDAGGHYGPVRR